MITQENKTSELQITRLTIEGKVRIKRKSKWVDRYAQIRDAFFQYKKDQYEINARFITDLRRCGVRRGTMEKDQGYFEIRDKQDKNADVILITFDNKELYQQWGKVFMESMRSDAELRAAAQKVIDAKNAELAEERRRAEEIEMESNRQSQIRSTRVEQKRRMV